MVAAGVTIHYVFTAFGAIPPERPTVQEMVQFTVDHTLFLNLGLGVLFFVLLWSGALSEGDIAN